LVERGGSRERVAGCQGVAVRRADFGGHAGRSLTADFAFLGPETHGFSLGELSEGPIGWGDPLPARERRIREPID
jgi:hypothetical protein